MAVLHMILIVFKILGVFLLIILGILMLAVAVILFCPVRYRAEGYKDERTYGGEVGISWLFHLISFQSFHSFTPLNLQMLPFLLPEHFSFKI